MALIEMRGIAKRYKTGDTETVALHDINLTVEKGEFVAIVGPSGSGKSTLMHILGLLDSPTTGEYLIDGEAMHNRPDSQLAKLRRDLIGFVFQTFNLLPRLNVLQNVMLPMAYAGVPARRRKQRALELLGAVDIADRASHRLNQISGGQTQRVAIARSLANNPKLILADEPTGNLDTKSSQAIVNLLKQLHQEGNTIIIVTHNPEIAAQTNRVIEIRDGKIVRDSQPRTAATARRTPSSSRPRRII